MVPALPIGTPRKEPVRVFCDTKPPTVVVAPFGGGFRFSGSLFQSTLPSVITT
jgi:hypothetical protein